MEALHINNPTFNGRAPKVIYKAIGTSKKFFLSESARASEPAKLGEGTVNPRPTRLAQDPRNLSYDSCFKNTSHHLEPSQAKVSTPIGGELQRKRLRRLKERNHPSQKPPQAQYHPAKEDTDG